MREAYFLHLFPWMKASHFINRFKYFSMRKFFKANLTEPPVFPPENPKMWLLLILLRFTVKHTGTCVIHSSFFYMGENKGQHTQKLSSWVCFIFHVHDSIIYLFFIFSFIFISWRLITLQYCSGFCHTLTWISHGFTCIPWVWNVKQRQKCIAIPFLW